MEKSHLSEHLQDRDNLKKFQQEALLLDVASLVYSIMKSKKISRKKLAADLQVSKGRIAQILGGERNLCLRTIADIFTALDCKLELHADDLYKGHWNLVGEEETKPRPS